MQFVIESRFSFPSPSFPMAQLSAELETFFARAQRDVDHALRGLIAPPGGDEPIPNLDDALAYALGLDDASANPGKRIRPLLCLLVCEALGGDGRAAMPFATAIELMHNFCLVHDDIEDGDEWRRGRPAVWKRYGLAHAINSGDYLFTKVFAALLSGGNAVSPEKGVRFFELMSSTLDHTHRGQALDINARHEQAMTVDHYMRLVTEKTGYYLAAPLVAGAIAADGGREVEAALNDFGLAIGPMFQIRDDLIDLTHGKGREAIGSDIREGKRSFLVAWVCERSPEEQCRELCRILDLPREETTPDHVLATIRLFESAGAFQEAQNRCEALKRQALDALRPLPERLRAVLEEVTLYLADRTA